MHLTDTIMNRKRTRICSRNRDQLGGSNGLAVLGIWAILTGGLLAEQVRLTKSSDPGGIVTGETWHETGTSVSVAAPPDSSGDQKFCYWTINGSRRADAEGTSVTSFSFTILETTTALAVYVPLAQDGDADGVPDWYELRTFGTTENPAGHDSDTDGRSLAQEYLDGTNPRAAEFVYQEASEPAGFANRRAFFAAGTVVRTTMVPMEPTGRRFVHWLLDGTRRETAVGVAATQLNVTMDENHSAVAVYANATADTDVDELPDWYEMFQYGTLANGADSDTDEDGRQLIDEYRIGAQPRIADTAVAGGIVEGGIARRRGGLLALEFVESRHRYEERSSPGGVLGSVTYWSHGASVSTGIAPASVSGFRFVHWTVNGVRQTGADGLPPARLVLTLTGDTVAEAVYLEQTQDLDTDGVPDWFETYHYGSTSQPAGSDTDGDGRSLAQEFSLGLNPLQKEWRFQQVSTPTGNVTARDQYLVDSSNVLTDNIVTPPVGSEFGQWTINGIRQETENGTALRSVRFNIAADTLATAVFLPLAQDSDADGVPDWYEVRNYGNLTQTATDDTDGDGRSLIDEYLLDTQPRIADSASSGLIVEGGVARRRGGLMTLVLSDAYRRYTERSTPPGIVAKEHVLLAGTTVTTTAAAATFSTHKFTQWLLNGTRQEGSDGLPLAQVSFTLNNDAVVEAVYLDATQDTDADGALDWFETYHYGTTALLASGDTDGDGRTMTQEFLDGTQPKRVEWRYTERSQPSGDKSRDEFVVNGTSVTTPTAAAESSGLRFVHWLFNGVRQVNAVGAPLSRLQFSIDSTVTTEAVYLNATLDADTDSLPDWYEVFHYGNTAQGPSSDTDGDGRSLLYEYQIGTQPLIADTAASGAVIEGGIARRRGGSLTLNLQFFPASQLVGAGGGGIFSDPYSGSSGSLVIPSGSSAPAMGDIDGDGDLDLLVGGTGGALRFLRNISSPFAPQYEELPATFNELPHWPTGRVYPALGDWNGDGRADLVVGSDDGVLRFYQTAATGPALFGWSGNLTVGSSAVMPAFFPASGGPDLLVLDAATGLVSRFARGSGTPPYAMPASVADLLGTPVVSGTSLAVADVTGDRIPDILTADSEGRIWRFNGSAGGSYTLTSKVWGGSFAGFRAGLTVAVVDFDGDGDPDIIGGGADGTLVYLRSPEKHLRITPAVVTVGTGEVIDFSSIDDNGTVVWSMGPTQSGASIAALTGLYTAGSTPGIDQVVTRNAAGRTGVAWVNVVNRGGSNSLKWRGLLVDGRRGPNDPVWPAAHALNTRAREVLIYRGLKRDDIRWLGHGEDGPDAAPTRAALQSAMRDGSALAEDTEVFLIYLADHGRVAPNGDGLFLLSENETVSGTELDAWLDSLQAVRPGLSVVVVVESCYGGRVAGPMMAADAYSSRRLVMAASGADELAHLAAGGLVSYSTMWWSGVASGKSLAQAHDDAVAAMASLQAGQRSAGGTALAAGKLGLGGVAGSGRPVVTVAQEFIQLQGTQETSLAVTVESPFVVEKVWGVVVPPGYRASGDAPVVDLTEVDLAKDAATGEWTANVGGFSEGGAPYTVLLQARDAWGQVSTPAILQVRQETIRNRVIIFAHGEDGWSGARVAGSLAAYAKEVALLRRVREQDVKIIADGVFADEGAAEASVSNLQNAIETWANADGQLGALTVFAVGQGSQEGLVCANGDAVTPEGLQGWLDTLQDESGATAQLIVDSDYSGRFVAGAGSSAHRRVVVSSTGRNERNSFASGQWSNVTRWMWNSIARGRDLRESYGEATDLARMIGVTVPAMFDDNGDGNFSKLRDGLKAINAFVGSAYVTADDPPFIGKASAMTQVAAGQSARFWVSNIVMPDGEAPQSVWCEVLGPDGTARGSLNLWHNPTKDRHEGSFTAFTEPGRYLIFVQAGTQGDPSRTTPPAVILVDYVSTPNLGAALTADLPALTLPLDGRTMEVESAAGGEWSLPLLRGQRVIVEACEVSTGRDVGIQLVGNNGQLLASADVWGNGFGEIIDGWEVPTEGTYRVRASFANGSGMAECKVRAFIKREAGAASFVSLPGQNISFTPPATHQLIDAQLNLVATATSSLPVRFELVSGPASLSGTTLTPTAAGTVILRALQDGDATWESAIPVERAITITSTAPQSYEAWAQEMFGADYATKGGSAQDADGDGQSNEVEWRAKTHPRNAADRFEIATATRSASGFKIRWQAREGVNYRIMVSTDLSSWAELPNSRVTGAGAEVERTDPATNVSGKFYRVEVLTP
jgi:hypothetical protein